MTGKSSGNYLLATFEGGGAVAPFITLARKLLARGHKVRILSDTCNRAEVEAAGAVFVPWTAAPSRPARGREHEPIRDWEAPTAFDSFLMLLEGAIVGRAADYASDIRAELLREPADLAVINDMLLGVQMGAESVGQRYVALACNVMPYPLVPGIPPMGPGLPPAAGPEDETMHQQIRNGTFAAFDAQLPRYNAARARFGLAPIERLTDQLFAAEKFLLATTRAFDFTPSQMPDFFDYVGPQLDDNLWSRPWVSPFAADDTRPLVLVGFSTTFQNQAAPLQRVIDALSELLVRVVVTLGGALRADEVHAAANTAIVDSAPHNQLIPEAALVVTHGGHGTLMKALVNGVPTLVMPFGRDQADNAIRVTHRGAGLSLPPEASTEDIRAALARLLDEPGFRAGAKALGAAICAEAEACCIVRTVESIAGENNSGALHPIGALAASERQRPGSSGRPNP